MFSFRVPGKNALGNQGKGRNKSCACVGSCLDKGIGSTVIVLGDAGRETGANLHYY